MYTYLLDGEKKNTGIISAQIIRPDVVISDNASINVYINGKKINHKVLTQPFGTSSQFKVVIPVSNSISSSSCMVTYTHPQLVTPEELLIRYIIFVETDQDMFLYTASQISVMKYTALGLNKTFSVASHLSGAAQVVGFRWLIQNIISCFNLSLYYILLPLNSLIPPIRKILEELFVNMKSNNLFQDIKGLNETEK